MARLHHYLRMKQYPIIHRIKLVFLGRWLISESSSSPLYINEIATSLGVNTEFMVNVLSKSSGKDIAEIRSKFLGEKGKVESYYFVPLIGFLPRPNQNHVHLTTNSLGFRGPERDYSKPIGVKRIILLGGSVAYGRTATCDENTIAANLELLMNKRDTNGTKWEVINLAAPALNSYQELLILQNYGIKYEPDIVISLSGYNDVHNYLHSSEVNEPPAMANVKAAYYAYYGTLSLRLLSLLSSFFVSAYYIQVLSQRMSSEESEEASPFIYTIW